MAAQERRGRAALGGAAIIAVLLVLGALIFSLDMLLRAQRPTFELVGVFEDASGVGVGTPVWLAGKNVGEVLSVSFIQPQGEDRGNVALLLELPAGLAPHVRQDSEIRLGSPQLLGAPVVRLQPGSPTAPPLAEGDTLWSSSVHPMQPLMARLPGIREQADTLMGELDRLLQATGGQGERLATVERRLDAAALQARRLDGLLRRGPLADALAPDGLRGSVGRLQARLDTLRTELGELSALTGDSAQLTVTRRALAERMALLRVEQAKLDSLMSGPYGTWGRFQTDSAVIHAVAGTRAALDSLFAELRAAPLGLFF